MTSSEASPIRIGPPGSSIRGQVTARMDRALATAKASAGSSIPSMRKAANMRLIQQIFGALARCDATMKDTLPVIYYMSIKAIEPISMQLLKGGHSSDTPAAIVFNAGGDDEKIIKTTLGELSIQSLSHCIKQPGLIMIGDITTYSYKTELGALRGRKLLLTCSEAIQEKAVALVHDFGGRPIPFPLIRLKSRFSTRLDCTAFNWLVVTSPSSIRSFMEIVEHQKIDYRTLPKIMVCGRGTGDELAKYGLYADAQPESGFSAEGLLKLAKETLKPGEKILRVRSDKAGPQLAGALRDNGAEVEDAIIYDNQRVDYEELPDFGAVFFASASAVESFIDQWGAEALTGKTICVIGIPTANALKNYGIQPSIIAREATVLGAINSLAEYFVGEELCSPRPD